MPITSEALRKLLAEMDEKYQHREMALIQDLIDCIEFGEAEIKLVRAARIAAR